jgi:hypothetical protein
VNDNPSYDIFWVDEDQEAVWQCAAEGIWNAKKKMEELAAKKPGKYYVFSSSESRVVARFDVPTPGPKIDRRRLAK